MTNNHDGDQTDGAGSGSGWLRRLWWRVLLAVGVLAVGLIAYCLAPKPTDTLREMLASQLNEDPATLFPNIPPKVSRHPGTLLMKTGDFILISGDRNHPTLEPGPRFGLAGQFQSLGNASGSVGWSVLNLATRSESDLELTISVESARSVEITDLRRWVRDSNLDPGYRAGTLKANIIMRAWEGQISLRMVRKRSFSAEGWLELTRKVDSAAADAPKLDVDLGAADRGTLVVEYIDPFVFAFQAADAGEILSTVSYSTLVGSSEEEPSVTEAVKELLSLDPYQLPDLQQTLYEIGPSAGQTLINQMITGDQLLMERGRFILENLPPESRPEVRDPGVALAAPEATERASAVVALADSDRPDQVQLISSALEDEDPAVRFLASESLRKLGPEALAAAPQVEAATQDRDPAVSLSAEVTRLSLEAASGQRFEVASEAIRAPRAESRIAGLRFLSEARLPQDSTTTLLLLALEDTASSVREEALVQLGRLGPQARRAIPALEALLEGADPETRRTVERTLQRIRGR